jgi:hypothetical protein
MKNSHHLNAVVLLLVLPASCSPEPVGPSNATQNTSKTTNRSNFASAVQQVTSLKQPAALKKSYTRLEANEIASELGKESDPEKWVGNLEFVALLAAREKEPGFPAILDFIGSACDSHSLSDLMKMLSNVPEELFTKLDKNLTYNRVSSWDHLLGVTLTKSMRENGGEVAGAEAASKIVDQLSSSPVADSMKAMVHSAVVASSGLDPALDKITAIQDPVIRGRTTALYLNSKAVREPIPILERFLAGDQRIPGELDMVKEVFRRDGQFQQNATAISTMIRDSKPSRQRDVASLGLAGALAYGDESAAREWTNQIQDPQLKNQAMGEIYKARIHKVQLGIPIEGGLP